MSENKKELIDFILPYVKYNRFQLEKIDIRYLALLKSSLIIKGKINKNQQNISKKAEKKPFFHLISQSTYDQYFRLKSKLDWNKINDDIYWSEGL